MALTLLAEMASHAADEIYVKLKGDATAILGNGGEFTAEKGNCYPFIGYDGTQTLTQLKFGSSNFWTRKENGEIVTGAATAEAAAKYLAELGGRAGREPAATPATGGAAVALLLDQPLRAAIREEVSRALAYTRGVHAVASFPVDASSPAWQNCGVRVKAGQHVLVEAAVGDTWNAGQGKTGAKGYDGARPDAGMAVFHSGGEGEDWHWGALICAVGDGKTELNNPWHQVEVGMKREFRVKNDGYLHFICNDSPVGSDGYDANSGIIHVKVAVTDAAGNPEAKAEEGESPAESAPPGDNSGDGGPAEEIAHQLREPLRTLIRQELWNALAGAGHGHEADAFPVDASSDVWQNSGVRVKAGQHVLVETAEGDMWNSGWGPIDAKGCKFQLDPNAGEPVFHTGRPNDDWHWGALVCAVGENRGVLGRQEREVEIGTRRGFTVDRAGYLYFICNDNPVLPNGGNGYDDNSGILHVKVTVTDPEDHADVEAEATATSAASTAAPAATPAASPAGN